VSEEDVTCESDISLSSESDDEVEDLQSSGSDDGNMTELDQVLGNWPLQVL
jgi:hypothetical protein